MDRTWVTVRMVANAETIAAQVRGLGVEEARWRPTADHWSVLEVVAHLADEEARDFRTRVDLTLHGSGEPWPPIDPTRWVAEERYNERKLADELARFLEERARSVAWLRDLEAPDWSRSYEHPALGTLRAGDVMAAWLGHDHIHIRQINRVLRAYAAEHALTGWSLAYAGSW